VRPILLSMLLAEKGAELNGENVDYFIKNGQLGWAIVALVIGTPASIKFFDFIGKFFARRFDNRDDLLKQMLDAQTREMEIRLAEANSRTAIAKALEESAKAHMKSSESIAELAQAIREAKK